MLTIGTTAYSNYSLDFFDEDNQSDDAFDDNQEINQLLFGTLPIIGIGATVTNIGAGQINISKLSLNTTGVTTTISVGSTVFSNYALDFFDEDNQDTTFESNEIIESEADDLLDFSEGNPFGTF